MADALILSTFPGVDIHNITQRRYDALLEQSFNMTNLKITGKIEYETERQKRKRLKEEYSKIKEEYNG